MERLKDFGRLLAGAFIGVILLFFAISQAIDGVYLGAAAATLAAILVFRPTRRLAEEHTNIHLTRRSLAIIASTLTLTSALLLGVELNSRSIIEEQRAAELSNQKAVEQAIENRQAYYKNKASIISNVSSMISSGNFLEAKAELDKYPVPDPDLERVRRLLGTTELRARLQNESEMSLDERLIAYNELAQLQPNDKAVLSRQRDLQEQVEKRDAKLRAIAARKAEIQNQFSSWDGSHHQLEKSIKNSMYNPKSYEHIQTRYKELPDGLLITTQFRGTNAFGGVVPSTVVAKVDRNGNVLEFNYL